ncbi:retrovirus-related pol polyprotein from transposon TNT 1-94 [Tanacetum coccineum]
MTNQQDIYATGSKNRPLVLNKENYVPWSRCLLRYAKSKPNRKLLVNSILHGPYVRRMIVEPGDPDREVPVAESFHEHTDEELTKKEVKQMEADDQAIQTILMGLPEDIYATVDSCETAQEIWLRIQQMMKELITPTPCKNPKAKTQSTTTDISDPTTAMNMALNAGNQVGHNTVQNPGIQNVWNQNGLIVISRIANHNANQNRNGNVVAARTEGNGNENNEAGIQLQDEEFDLMDVADDIYKIEKVNANCILMPNFARSMNTSEDQYTELLKPITEPHLVQQNTSNVIIAESSVEHNGGTVEHHATIEETHAYFESLYNNLVIKVEKVNTVNRKMKETNADLTTELARYKGQEKCFEFNQEKFDKLESSYKNSVYQEQCLIKKINALHLSYAKQITTLNEEIANLNNQLSKEKSTVSYLQEERKKLKDDFKIHENELLDKLVDVSNTVSKPILIPDDGFSDNASSPSVARKFLNEVKDTIVTLQRVVKSKMSLNVNNWSSTVHQQVYKILKYEIAPIVNQVDVRVIKFEKQFLKEASKFVRDIKSIANEADEYLDMNKVLEYKNERLLRVVKLKALLRPEDHSLGEHTSSECNNTNLAIRNEKYEVISATSMMGEINISTLTLAQYFRLIEENQASGMVNDEFRGMMEKDIEDMTIAEYMEYEAKMKRQSRRDAQSYFPTKYDDGDIGSFHLEKSRTFDYPHYADDLPPFHLEKKECKAVYKGGEMKTFEADTVQEVSSMASNDTIKEDDRLSGALPCQLPPKEKTDMLVEMADMTQQAPLGTVENILVKNDKCVFPCDFVVIDMPGILSDMMILGRSFLATNHAQIDVFNGEFSLGIGEDRVKFDVNENSHHSNVALERVYMQNTRIYTNSNIETIDSPNNMQETSKGHTDRLPDNERITSRWHVCKPVRVFYDDGSGEDCGMWPTCNLDLSFCSGYEAVYGKGEH